MLFVDVERGRAEGIALAHALQGGGKALDSQSVRSEGSRHNEEAEEYIFDRQ